MSAEIRARLAEIDGELFGRSAYARSDILARSNPRQQLERERHFARLRAERETLLRQLPTTGEAAGHLVMSGSLGTVYVREDPPPDYHIGPRDEWDWTE